MIITSEQLTTAAPQHAPRTASAASLTPMRKALRLNKKISHALAVPLNRQQTPHLHLRAFPPNRQTAAATCDAFRAYPLHPSRDTRSECAEGWCLATTVHIWDCHSAYTRRLLLCQHDARRQPSAGTERTGGDFYTLRPGSKIGIARVSKSRLNGSHNCSASARGSVYECHRFEVTAPAKPSAGVAQR